MKRYGIKKGTFSSPFEFLPLLRARGASVLFAALFLNAFAFTLSSAADWPAFRGNWARTGYASEQAAPPLTPRWTFPAEGGIMSSPAVFENTVYFGARDGRVYALDARTGVERWRFQTGNWVEASPGVSSGTVYAASMDGYLYALDRRTGGLVWRAPLGGASVSSPLVLDGRVYAGAGIPAKRLQVFDAQSGSLLGGYAAQQPVDSAAAAYGGKVYFGANDGVVYSAAAGIPGSAAWTYPTAGSFRLNAVAVASGTVYALPGHDEKKLLGLDAVTGPPGTWSPPVESGDLWETFSSPVVNGGRVYFSGALADAATSYLYAFDAQLDPVWTSSISVGLAGVGMLSSPAMANDILYAGTVDGRLVAVSSEGVSVGEISLSSSAYSSPAIANGWVYIGSIDGKMAAFSAEKTASISSPAPGDIVSGTVTVRGYISHSPLSGYTLEYGPGAAPAGSDWLTLVTSDTVSAVDNGILAVWVTTSLPNGLYALRLTVLPAGALDNTALLTLRVNSAPGAPGGLTASDVPADNGNQIRLAWNAPSQAGYTGYRIYRSAAGFLPVQIGSAASATPAYYTDAAAATGVDFTYTVRSFDGYVESEDSNSVSTHSVNNNGDLTAPAGITDLVVEPGITPGTVQLTWTAPGNDGNLGTAALYFVKCSPAAGYDGGGPDSVDISGSTVPVEGPAGDNQSVVMNRLRGGIIYSCAVKTADLAHNVSVLSNISSACATIDLSPPLPPAALAAADTLGDDGGSITLNWTLSPDDGTGVADVYGYKIYRRLQDETYVSSAPYKLVDSGVSTSSDTAATENVRFYYSVAAYDSTNDSSLSGEASGISVDNWRLLDAAGGVSLRLPDGARLDIPDNGVDSNDNIMMLKVDPVTFQPQFAVKANTGVNPTAVVYEVKFKNTATKLVKNAVLTLPYTDGDVAGMTAENLRIYTLSGGTWMMLNTSKVDLQAKKVRAEISHLSLFRLMEYVPSGGILAAEEVYTYPNPAKGDTLTFKFLPAYKADVAVDVYNVAGEKVTRLEKAACPAGLPSEIAWGIKNIASGVYVYRVEAKSASGSKTVEKKLAIIH